jgi:hypothetical protein
MAVLPRDIWIKVLIELEPSDILSISLVSKEMNQTTNVEYLWVCATMKRSLILLLGVQIESSIWKYKQRSKR